MAKYSRLRERCSRRASSRRSICTKRRRPPGTICGWCTTPDYVDAVANGTLRARHAAAHRLSVVAADGRARAAIGRRDHRRGPRGAGRRRGGQPGRRHASRVRRSRRGLLRLQRRRGRRRVLQRDSTPAASRSSISTCTRATAPRRSSPAIHRCSRSRCTARRTSRSGRKPATSTSSSTTARAMSSIWTQLHAHLADGVEPAPAGLRLLSRRRRSLRGRSARPAQADHRWPAPARRARARTLPARRPASRDHDERRLRARHRRHRHHPRQHDSRPQSVPHRC